MKTTGYISDMDRYLFGQGTHYEIYKKLGSHPAKIGKKKGIYFSVWAPNAKSVSLVGNFNNWDISKHRMNLLPDSGIYEIFTSDVEVGDIYKYAIQTYDNQIVYKADPYANESEYRPGTASQVIDLTKISWSDKKWLNKRAEKNPVSSPISIYEMHIGSWKTRRDEHENRVLTYTELAKELTEYIKELGYTHVQLMGVAEYPLDDSLGYQVTGYYSPTSRYGSSIDFANMINYLHNNGIGVIIDWVPAHFSRDAHGLYMFDGKPLYEPEGTTDSTKWGTSYFDYGKKQVSNFLIANALFWINEFHIDGIHVGSLSFMINNKNRPAIHTNEAAEFLKHLNSIVKKHNPGVIMIAEDSYSSSNDTLSLDKGGLGFDFMWNEKWNYNFMEYIKLDPYFRQFNHKHIILDVDVKNTKYILPISHNDVQKDKGSMYEKITDSSSNNKFEALKVAYTYQIAYPGKKLMFMGQEFGQDSFWNYEHQLDWYLKSAPKHRNLFSFVKSLQTIYKKFSCMYTDDRDLSGFKWINNSDNTRSIISFVRTAPKTGTNLIFVLNFTPKEYKNYSIGVFKKCKYTTILDENRGYILKPEKNDILTPNVTTCNNLPFSLTFDLDSFGIKVFKYI